MHSHYVFDAPILLARDDFIDLLGRKCEFRSANFAVGESVDYLIAGEVLRDVVTARPAGVVSVSTGSLPVK